MKIRKMRLHNFKCHKELEIEFSSDITKICGMNGAGKTSIFDAYLWTLFDRNADGTNNPTVRPIDSDGNKDENIDVSVELTISVDGDEHTIKKTQKRLGTGNGNKNEYEIDGHPMIKREFNDFILNLLAVGKDFDILSDPYALMKQPYEKIREKITSTQNKASDIEIANMFGDKYSLIIPELKNFKTDDIVKKHKRDKEELNKKQKELKIRIDESNKRRVTADIPALEVEKTAKEVALKKVEDELAGGSGKLAEINEKREAVMKLKFHISEIQNEENQKLFDKSKIVRDNLNARDRELSNVKREIGNLSDEIKAVDNKYDAQKMERDRLLVEYHSEKDKKTPEFAPFKAFVSPEPLKEDDFYCPTCGKALTEEEKKQKISEYDKLLANKKAAYEKEKSSYDAECQRKKEEFLTKHNARIKELIEDGKSAEASMNKLKANEAELRKEMDELNIKLADAQKKYDDAKAELDKFPTEADISENADYKATTEKISALEKEIEAMSAGASTAELEDRKSVLKNEIIDIAGKIKAADNTKIDSDIAEYEKNLDEVEQNLADEVRIITLTEDFDRTKMNMISDSVNSLFGLVKWKLFQNLENGSMRKICVCTVDGIDYPAVNDGHKILAGLDIINTFSKLCGVRLPIFIDRAGELNTFNLPKMENQIILLKVTDDKELKVESEDVQSD